MLPPDRNALASTVLESLSAGSAQECSLRVSAPTTAVTGPTSLAQSASRALEHRRVLIALRLAWHLKQSSRATPLQRSANLATCTTAPQTLSALGLTATRLGSDLGAVTERYQVAATARHAAPQNVALKRNLQSAITTKEPVLLPRTRALQAHNPSTIVLTHASQM